VALETVAGWPLAAEVLHQPLGVLGFVVACGLGATLLLLRPELQASRTAHPPPRPHLPPVLVGVGLVLLVALPALDGLLAAPSARLALPAVVSASPITDQERAFAAEQGGAITKGTFEVEGLRGAAVFVTSRTWRAQHLPEHCLQAHGIALSELRPEWIDGHAVRYALAERPSGEGTALWWFQSVDQATDDYTERIWADLTGDRPWVLVSLLLDGQTPPTDPVLVRLVHDLGDEVARSLMESS